MAPPLLRSPLADVAGGALPWESGGGGVAVVAPANTVAPVISSNGSVIGVGETLTTTNGTGTGTAPVFTYQWQRGATFGGGGSFANIALATASTYLIVAADVGFTLRCVVTATNAAAAVSANSNSLIYLHATDLPNTAVWVSQSGVTTADAGSTVDSWASAFGGRSATIGPAASGSVRPAYSATGGVGSRPLITWDGVDDVIKGVVTTGSAFDGTTGCTMAWLGQRVSFASAGDVWMQYEDDISAAALYAIRDVSASLWRGTDISVADLNATSDPDGVNALYQFDLATNAWAVRKNGTSEATSASAVTARNDSEVLALGGRTTSSAYANVSAQAIVFGKLLGSSQRTNLRALLTNATGVSV